MSVPIWIALVLLNICICVPFLFVWTCWTLQRGFTWNNTLFSSKYWGSVAEVVQALLLFKQRKPEQLKWQWTLGFKLNDKNVWYFSAAHDVLFFPDFVLLENIVLQKHALLGLLSIPASSKHVNIKEGYFKSVSNPRKIWVWHVFGMCFRLLSDMTELQL